MGVSARAPRSPCPTMSEPLLRVLRATKRYEGVVALQDASFDLLRGEVHALMGENGAGKSTLIKLLAGVVPADALELEVRGARVALRSAADAQRLGLRFIHQELNVVPALSVAENVFLGRPYPLLPRPWGSFGAIDWRRLQREASEVLAGIGVTHVRTGTIMSRLSVGDAMLVNIARAFVDEASLAAVPARGGRPPVAGGTSPSAAAATRVYIMDEPTAALSRSETERLFGVVRGLRARGCGVVYVSHRLEEIFEVTDRITVLRDGRVVGTTTTRAATPELLIRQMTGRAWADLAPGRAPAAGATSNPDGRASAPQAPAVDPPRPPVLVAEGVTNQRLRDVDLALHAGEIVGLAGLVGAGRSELLRALAGIDRRRGRVLLARRNGSHRRVPTGGGGTAPLEPLQANPTDAWRRGLAYVPEERRSQGLIMRDSVRANMVLPHLARVSRLGVALGRRETNWARELARLVDLKARGPGQPVHELSGGNQQKVVLARALAASPTVLLLDEPTRGVDVGAKSDIYRLVREAAIAGAAVLLASSDLPEVLALTDRVLVLRKGRLHAEVPTASLDQARLLTLMYGEEDV